jgi:tRNA(Ile)-lysidine synthase
VRLRVIRIWLLGAGATGLAGAQIRTVEALVTDWRGQGGVAVGSAVPAARLFAERHGEVLRLRGEPVV